IDARCNVHHFGQPPPDDPSSDHHDVASSRVPAIVTVRSSALLVSPTVMVMLSPTPTSLSLEWLSVLSLVEALFGLPPKAVLLIFTVTVAVPALVSVVTSVIVNATGQLTITG